MRLLLVGIVVTLLGCGERPDGKVHISYWEKWGGAEAEAMQRVVDQFNRSQNRIVVEYLSIANVDRKTLVATAGGDPPDVAGVWLNNLYSFSDADALLPLDDFIRADGFTVEQWQARYYLVYADMCSYRGKIWGVVSTPSMTALHWNKTLFRAAGLDPDRPPRTLAELDEFAEKLSKRDPATGQIVQLGFLPQEPGWFAWSFPQWFGGRLWDGTNITIGTTPENLASYQWVAGYTQKYGLAQVRAFTAGFGNFASPQNPFMNGQIAMVFQGVWMNNYLRQFAPGFDCGVAAWPTAAPGLENFSVADADVLAIPRGAKHPREAWEFIRYVSTSNPQAETVSELRGMELLCFGQQKNSPLREWSPAFEKLHPHPQIKLFRQLAESPNAVHIPKISIWQEFSREQSQVFESVRLLGATPEEALAFCQNRLAKSWELQSRSFARRQADVKP
ncbi:MAG: ABC transporter substrate-binding protein [Verrucomicrobiota bacterium]